MKSKEDLRTELFIEVYSNIKHTMKDTCPWWHSINIDHQIWNQVRSQVAKDVFPVKMLIFEQMNEK